MKCQIPDSCELVVVSDIHIREPSDDRAKLFLELIAECKVKSVKNLILNGDIFDFFYGRGSYFKQKYQVIFSALTALSPTTNVIFVEGNHEFGLERLDIQGIAIRDGLGGSLQLSRTLVVFCHGDLMIPDWKYNVFRGFVRSGLANGIASIIPQKWLDGFTTWLAKTSRKKDKYRTLNHERIQLYAEQFLKKHLDTHSDIHSDNGGIYTMQMPTTLVFGHFHYPYDIQLQSHKILSVQSWDQPSILVIDQNRHDRQFLSPQN